MHINIEGLIPLAGGIYGSLLGFKFVSISNDDERQRAWYEKFGKILKVCGPIVIIFGIAQLFTLL